MLYTGLVLTARHVPLSTVSARGSLLRSGTLRQRPQSETPPEAAHPYILEPGAR